MSGVSGELVTSVCAETAGRSFSITSKYAQKHYFDDHLRLFLWVNVFVLPQQLTWRLFGVSLSTECSHCFLCLCIPIHTAALPDSLTDLSLVHNVSRF